MLSAIIGVVAAVLSLKAASSDYLRSINLAIVAASATFGSNIYNISYSVWCIFRQNLANKKNKILLMIPFLKISGNVTPISQHSKKPHVNEFDSAISVLTALSLLTAAVAISMVIFGKVAAPHAFGEDLYRLTKPVAIAIFLLCIFVLYFFRKSQRPESLDKEIIEEEKYYSRKSTARIWLDLALSAIAILLAAEAMVRAVESFSIITGMPFVIAGVLAGIIGCLGEMITIHQFVVNPKGRIGDAVVGVAMDNIVTTLGASVVAIIGGVFLG
ncbi:hypothetical protein HY227_00335, partial [Candidatus Wolfebacteria bacterium]|nr:hypothetical protein [Candidatus Wolfebacteria bacterium]